SDARSGPRSAEETKDRGSRLIELHIGEMAFVHEQDEQIGGALKLCGLGWGVGKGVLSLRWGGRSRCGSHGWGYMVEVAHLLRPAIVEERDLVLLQVDDRFPALVVGGQAYVHRSGG